MTARKKPLRKILIANRGEIACRVIRTAGQMGLQTVAVYSHADRDAPHVRMADEAVCIGPAPARESYLRGDKIIAACEATKAQAVHPGYGFLSENAAFARQLKRAGIVFIGPSARVLKIMGDKIEAKKWAEKAGLNVVPGQAEALTNFAHAKAVAKVIGYPVMLKAAAGGGGKGMRVCADAAALKAAFVSARREAKSSFDDDRVFLEKFIENPRHIEIQILADRFGHVIHLGERECSLQRRHQKVIEEAPSVFLDAATRAAMGAQAVILAKAVKYVSVGTVEFIVDAQRKFYFLEMNTRLQVEHPVTECVTGLDLVKFMIRTAMGEPLKLTQDEVKINGWAMEARVYAEDPERGFLPSSGRLTRYRLPEGGLVRVDSGVIEGGEISIHYDPLMAKVITFGADRERAIQAMTQALDGFEIQGVRHNLSFLSALMTHPKFIAGQLTTGFIAQEYPNGYQAQKAPGGDPSVVVALAAVLHQADRDRILGSGGGVGAWTVVRGKKSIPVTVRCQDGGFDVVITARGFPREALSVRTDWQVGERLMRAQVNGQDITVQVQRLALGYRLIHAGAQVDLCVMHPRAAELLTLMPKKREVDVSKRLLSPMPGLLLSVAVTPGQAVKAGDALAVIEAMKMENVLRCAQDGIIAKVQVQPGDSLAVDQEILTFEDSP